jgi:hypothetical protein
VTGIVWLTVAIKPLCYKLVQAYTQSVCVEQTYAVVKMEAEEIRNHTLPLFGGGLR